AAHQNQRFVVVPFTLRNKRSCVIENAIDWSRKIFQEIGAIFHHGDIHPAIESEFGDRERTMTGPNKIKRRAQILRFDHNSYLAAANGAERIGSVLAQWISFQPRFFHGQALETI